VPLNHWLRRKYRLAHERVGNLIAYRTEYSCRMTRLLGSNRSVTYTMSVYRDEFCCQSEATRLVRHVRRGRCFVESCASSRVYTAHLYVGISCAVVAGGDLTSAGATRRRLSGFPRSKVENRKPRSRRHKYARQLGG